MKLKTGIIGCGKVGDFHAKAYAQLENSEFTAVCDADLERAKAFAERYNVHAYSDIAEMIQKEHLDVVSVCTPHPIHCDPAVTAAENGCNVLIEKPLASSLADCDRIIEAGDKNHVTIGTMVQRRFYRPCMRIHEAIEAGKIGKPVPAKQRLSCPISLSGTSSALIRWTAKIFSGCTFLMALKSLQ